jgi:hypothetical protein
MSCLCRTYREEPIGAPASLRSGALVTIPFGTPRVPETPPFGNPAGFSFLAR